MIEQVKAALDKHRIRAFGPDDCACSCSHEWRKHAEHRDHVAEVIAALLPEVTETVEWGVRDAVGGVWLLPGAVPIVPDAVRVSRTRRTYADQVSEWTEVESR